MKTMILGVLILIGALALCPPSLAAQDERKESTPATLPAPTVDAVRRAYTEGRDKDVLIMAERALIEASTAGDPEGKAAELYFWKGSSLRRLGRYEESVIALEHSKALGYSGPELYLERGLANKSLGKTQEAKEDYQEAERRFPADPEQRDIYLKHWKWDGAEQPRFQLWLAPQVGWDSNVVGLDPNTPLEQGKTRFDSYYAGAYLDTRVYVVKNDRQMVWLEYQLLGREYPQDQTVSFLDNLMSITGRQPLLDNLDLEVRGSWEEAVLRDTGHFRTQRMIGPAFLLKPVQDLQARVWADWTDASYYESVPAPQNRDGSLSRAGVTLAIDLGYAWALGPYCSVNKSNSTGGDYDAHGWETGVQLSSPELSGFKVVALVSYSEETYANLNSLSGFTKKRLDRPLGANLTVTFKQIEKWLGYAPTLAVGYLRHESNIGDFNYTRWTPQFEVSLGVLSF